ncbi:rhodanese-like domain-containing protein [Granulicatella sp. zg-ZJ]|uniref:rhodanese-like domain-containing protein n=1 Tax=unclassified Granulicatella TaxID=2630493 RepID=UPI0013C1C762|nr:MULTISPECIES: rhodanese-like domain-containing protein [unclassified Granulicatella]MBS4750576.1 rhodanese-like domain-containing protein [Carnobacteriaceae bacterium zg-ZUI78]NEW62957.1 rhodanese-like domain-containing protein [Granulicatella sp. zg-ZJ]NEW66649.1 rhodanese-like domain-containing protein [Granulicatella sp. zg-84]QMI85330.1 rhodanese-like domain-containing protein [Carnobacteriaceae bacterium zg-84]
MEFWSIFQLLVMIFVGGYFIYQVYLFIERRSSAKYITQEEFRENMRKAQVIDVREKAEFDVKHILGARNIPYTQFKQRMGEIRKDQPIYLCDDFALVAGKAAGKLKRKGYTDIYILRGGMERWSGKIKSNRK